MDSLQLSILLLFFIYILINSCKIVEESRKEKINNWQTIYLTLHIFFVNGKDDKKNKSVKKKKIIYISLIKRIREKVEV